MRGVRNLSYQELMERRAKGLYFKCGQHYSPMHCCPKKELKLLVQEEDEDEILESSRDNEEKQKDKEEWEMVCRVVELNELKSQGKLTCKTMKLEGKLEGVPILLLVNSGTSHNYITRKLVVALNLSISETKEYVVSLGDGSTRSS